MPKVTLVDKDDNVLGEKEKFAAHRHPVPLHRAISILGFNDKGEMLITRRADDKFTWASYWTNTVCTNVAPDETYLECAKRRLKEELGVDGKNFEELFSFTYDAVYNDEYGENELDHTFKCLIYEELTPDPEELSEYKWVTLDWLSKDINENPDKYTPWFKIIMEKYNS